MMRMAIAQSELRWLQRRGFMTFSLLFMTAALTVCVGCSPVCPAQGPADFVDRPTFGIAKRGSPLELRASCGGDQLVGGGYWTDLMGGDSETSFSPHSTTVPIILASYPSQEGNSWVVRFLYRGAGAGSHIRPEDDWFLVGAHAYCVSNAQVEGGVPVLPLGMGIKQQGETGSSQFGVGADVTVLAPAGSVVTGGGFRMEYAPDPSEPHDDQNGYVDGSAPIIQGGAVTGWRVHRQPQGWGPASATAYVLYATQNLQPGTPVTSMASPTPNWWAYTASLKCAGGEFTTGGGFDFQNTGPGANVVGHTLIRDLAGNSFTQWDVYGYDGFQMYKQPNTSALAVSAICLKSPYPKLCVKITSPNYGTTVPLGASEPATTTVPIQFAATAYRGSTALPGTNITWVVNGSTLATGDSPTTALTIATPVSHKSTYMQDFYVQAVVHDGNRSASDTVLVSVANWGQIP
jgi:hypothetical protein